MNASSDPPSSAPATPKPSRGRILTLLALGYGVTAGWAVDRYGYDSFFLYLSAAIYFVAAAAILMVPEATKYHDGSNHDPAPVTGRQGAT